MPSQQSATEPRPKAVDGQVPPTPATGVFEVDEVDAALEKAAAKADKDTATPTPSSLTTPTMTPTSPSLAAIDDEPNWPRGWRPWTCLAGCFFLMFNSWGLVNAYGTFGSYYIQHGLAPTDAVKVNLIGALQCFIVLGFSGIVGRLLDAGFTRWCLGVGTVFVTAGSFALGPANHGNDGGGGTYAGTLVTQGVVTSLGMACFFVASSQIAATWFKKQKTLAVGIVACGASVAGLVYPVTTKFLLEDMPFKYVAMCDAAIVCATALFAFVFAAPNKAHNVRKPKSWVRVDTWIDPHAYHNAAWWAFTVGVAFLFLGFYAIFFNLEEWAAAEGFGKKDRVPDAFNAVTTTTSYEVPHDAIRTFYLLSIMNIMSSFGRIGGGLAGQRWGTLLVHWSVTATAAALCLFLWIFVSNVGGAVAFVVTFGVFSGAVIGMPPASVMYILERDPNADNARVGQWVGMMYTVAAIPALIGPVIAGVLVERTDSYLPLQLWSGLCLAISAACMALSHWKVLHDQEREWVVGKMMMPLSAFTSRRSSPSASTADVSEKKRQADIVERGRQRERETV